VVAVSAGHADGVGVGFGVGRGVGGGVGAGDGGAAPHFFRIRIAQWQAVALK